MPYAVPSIADFKTRFGEFSTLSDPQITSMLTLANRFVDETWIEGDFALAILYLAAHLASMSRSAALQAGAGTGGSSAGTEVFLKSIKFADRSITYDARSTGGATESISVTSTEILGDTMYGQIYLMLLRRNAPLALIV